MNACSLLAALSASWLLLGPPLSAHQLRSVEAEPGEQISRALAADQRIRTEDEKQESLDRERRNARAQRDEDIRYYWWWPFRR